MKGGREQFHELADDLGLAFHQMGHLENPGATAVSQLRAATLAAASSGTAGGRSRTGAARWNTFLPTKGPRGWGSRTQLRQQ